MERPDDGAWHQLPAGEVTGLLGVEPERGLTRADVLLRQASFGPNRVTAQRRLPAWLRLLGQLRQPLVYILLLAVAVTAIMGEWVDAWVILGVVLVNAVAGFLQESRAQQAIGALAHMIATQTDVRRDSRKQRVPSDQLVPGDVVLLRAGDRVPADIRLVRARNLSADESALTGESLPVAKSPEPVPPDTILAERTCVAYGGTFVTAGQAEGVVVAIGDRTETGRIAGLIRRAVETATPLTRKIAQFSALVLWAIVALALATFALGVVRGERPIDMFMAAVALAVGAVPEGLPAAVTIVLAIGVSRLARRRAIIRRLPAVETLGSTTVICADKTGTLTKNQMTVQDIFAAGLSYQVTGAGYDPVGEIRTGGRAVELDDHPVLAECLRAGILCNDSHLAHEDGVLRVHGDPTEAAMVVAAAKAGLAREEAQQRAPRLDMIPFESGHMFRATLHQAPEGRVLYLVGAMEPVLDRCADALRDDNSTWPLDRDAIHGAAVRMAERGLRVLAFARRRVPPEHGTLEHADVEARLTFLGLQGMIDPPRPEAVAAVHECRRAGIDVKMITGDHLVTARAIAAQIGLAGPAAGGSPAALSGRELDQVPDDALPSVAHETAVFARVAPEQKLRLVRALQSRGEVVAMTGDGVNDAPALKQADIGVAMGIGGTDVARGAAAMVLTDDNFASIAAAVEEGRAVFDNLTKFIVWIIPSNLGEALLLIAAISLGLPLPVLPLQLLWINLTDTLLGLSLAFEPGEADTMRRPPRDPRAPLLTFPLLMRTGLVSSIMVGSAIGMFLWELHVEQAGLVVARTAVINVIVLVQVAYLFNCRSLTRSGRALGPFTNRWLVAGTLTMLGAQVLLTHVPLMNRLFHTAPLGGASWLRIAAVAGLVFAVVEFEKWLRFGRRRAETVARA